jgi:acyl carrier protein
MEDKIRETVSNIMLIPLEEVTAQSSPETIEAWDSLKHMALILALEEEFGIRFSEEQIEGMNSITAIAEQLAASGA